MAKTTDDDPVERIDGRLHAVRHIFDEAGRVVGTITTPLHVEMKWDDFGQLVAGACILSIPLAMTEEIWDYGETLSMGRTVAIVLVSVVTLAAFVRGLFFPGDKLRQHPVAYTMRVLVAYLTTFLVASFVLCLVDQGSFDEPLVLWKRAVLVAFPASFAAATFDYIK